MPDSKVPISTFIELYKIESGLIQRKVNQILTIRSISVTFLVGILTLIGVLGQTSISMGVAYALILLFIPFYLLESVYDSHLIPMHNRELLLKEEIAKMLNSIYPGNTISDAYKTSGVSLFDLSLHWPLFYALTRKIRIVYYAIIVIIYVLVVTLITSVI
ncbi:hypothetical protein IX51_00990 [uncultured archaeon]|nr:hypothetical protein IX51_00990 [uncultured archaeon]